MGSGGMTAAASSRSYNGRNGQWAVSAEELKEEKEGLYNGGSTSASAEGAAPRFLVEADELYDDDSGESRLVAPPVLGEGPQTYF